jgi:cobalt-zinc-cadmium efflux system membrane fusion protein
MTLYQNESHPHAADHASHLTKRAARIRRLLRAVMGSFPTLVVLFALAGVGIWGHAHSWRAPKFASLFGDSSPREQEDWCAEHNVPESRCIKCHPELVGDTTKDWCKEHGVPESRCTICHPEILTKGVAGDWCKEHGVPESNCTICHPEIAVRGQAPTSHDSVRVVASDEPEPPAKAPKVKDPATCQTHALRVQFASPESVRKAGVQLASVIERPMAQTISANAETQYDRTRFAQVASRVPGVVWRVDKEIGESVRMGDVLALVDAAEVGRAKAELLTASAQREVRAQSVRRIDKLLPQKISTEAELQEAQAALREAEIRVFNARQALINLGLAVSGLTTTQIADERELQLLGLPAEVRATLDAGAPSANLVPIVAPLDGVVIQRDVVAGEVVEASKPLFAVADTRRMWLTIDVSQTQIGRVAIGQTVRFQPERSDGTAQGRISWRSTAVDDQTRTVKVRADLDNAEGWLLASTFGRAWITVRESSTAIAVPNEAIQWEGCCHVVFVRLTDDIFQTRKVRLGTKDTHYAEVLAGLLPGEVVATVGSHVLKSEILKSNLGAGCCAEE